MLAGPKPPVQPAVPRPLSGTWRPAGARRAQMAYNAPAMRYLYLDYGGLPQYRRELKYSLISLRAGAQAARIAIYTDAPAEYANWPVETVAIGTKIESWSAGGLYRHRIKPAMVKDALARFAEPVLLLDCDSIVRPGFHAEAEAALEKGAIMNRFERKNPFPPLKGLRARLPHLGAYRYDPAESHMYNSGLIGVRPEHYGLFDDVLALIDAAIGRVQKFPTVEQFALSEVLRLNRIPVTEIHGSFLHYWQGRRRLYMAHVIEKSLSPDWDDLRPPAAFARMNGWNVRAYSYYHHTTRFFRGARRP